MTVETTQGTVTVTIDGFEIRVPKGTLVIRAAELLGIQIPRFCDHPLLDRIGACRQCLVEVEGQRKPMASCTIDCTEGMVVRTQLTSAVAEKAQRGVMELLLINHPLDCPMCDKGGECPLQNQAMSSGQGETRYAEEKRTFPKPVPISTQVLLDRERCISCTRCVRTSEEIAGDPFIDFFERGPSQFIGTAEGKPFNSYFSGNTVQVCPVGALTGAAYRFRSRPFDLVSVPSVCEHCASGCRQRTDVRRGRVTRRLAGDDPAVNEEWNCDKGRWAFTYATQPDRLTTPLIRDESGVLVPASWPHALAVAAAGLEAARGAPYPAPQGEPHPGPRGVGVLTGGRLTLEDAYAYAKFARVALDTNDVDMRARPHSAEEEQFLAACVAGRGIGVSYADLEQAPAVLLAGFEPEDESPIVFLRLRKAVRRRGLQVFSVAALASPGLAKLSGELLATLPGDEAAALTALAIGGAPNTPEPPVAGGIHSPAPPLPDWQRAGQAIAAPGAVILVGERLAEVPGALAAAARLAAASGARLAWVPRRAGERGAVEAGALPGLLPIGRPVTDASARAEVARTWGKSSLPATPGRDAAAMLDAAVRGELGALVVAGVDPADLPDPRAALRRDRDGAVRRQPRAAGERGHRPRRRGLPGRRGGGEGRHVRELGRARRLVRRRAAGPGGPHRPVRARRDRRPDGRAPGPARRGGRAGRTRRARHLARHPPRAAGGDRGLARRTAGPPRQGFRGARRPAGDLAPAAGQRADAGRRAVTGRHRPAGRGEDVRGDRGRGRRGRRR